MPLPISSFFPTPNSSNRFTNMDISINTENYGRVHNHGGIEIDVSSDGLEHELDVDIGLTVAGDGQQSPQSVTEEFAEKLESLVQEYAI